MIGCVLVTDSQLVSRTRSSSVFLALTDTLSMGMDIKGESRISKTEDLLTQGMQCDDEQTVIDSPGFRKLEACQSMEAHVFDRRIPDRDSRVSRRSTTSVVFRNMEWYSRARKESVVLNSDRQRKTSERSSRVQDIQGTETKSKTRSQSRSPFHRLSRFTRRASESPPPAPARAQR
jgi:hypothetical protein